MPFSFNMKDEKKKKYDEFPLFLSGLKIVKPKKIVYEEIVNNVRSGKNGSKSGICLRSSELRHKERISFFL